MAPMHLIIAGVLAGSKRRLIFRFTLMLVQPFSIATSASASQRRYGTRRGDCWVGR